MSDLGFFIQAPVSHLSGVDLNEKSLKFRGVPQQDLLDYPPQVPFNIPELLPIFRSDEFVKLGELDDVAIHRGLQQPLPDAYYFTKSEIDKSSISSDLFSPIITYETLANSGRVVTEAEMEQYVLDLTEQVKEVKRSIDDSSMEEILDGLSNQGIVMRLTTSLRISSRDPPEQDIGSVHFYPRPRGNSRWLSLASHQMRSGHVLTVTQQF